MRTLSIMAAVLLTASAQAKTIEITVENKSKETRQAVPVVVDLRDVGLQVSSAIVRDSEGREVACQLDDYNADGIYDELCLICNLEAKKKAVFTADLLEKGSPRDYEPQVYVEMMMSNKKIKATNKQDLYISSLTVDKGVNPYWMLHHHGPAFENDMVAYRIYFDHRQTVDIYGKYKRGLEIRDTQFYPDTEQKKAGYGDDVLWVGETFGLGTLRGWNGSEPQMISDVDHRTLSIVSRGPLRTIVRVKDERWNGVDMTTLYTLYAGRRDCFVDVSFSQSVGDRQFATGIINVKNSTEYSDGKGLRGCWGTDWPVSEKDSAGHKRETVGLGICVPTQNVAEELPANKDNYPYVIGGIDKHLTYGITFASDNETFASQGAPEGFHSADQWFAYLEAWKREIENPVKISIKYL